MHSYEIRPLSSLDQDAWDRIVTGYVSDAKYTVNYTESETETVFRLTLTPLNTPYVKQFGPLDEQTLAEYQQSLRSGFSLGIYDDDILVGIALALPQHWNNSLWLQEFHVAESHRGKGVGRALMGALITKGQAAGFRVVMCETQNTNVPAIRFYRRLGFLMQSVDLSLYSNTDYPDGEIAIFMKYKFA